ncbi:MAG: CPBP family intramembrane metalloprotease [Ruminococcus sp.]|nr:CPBP family intramembrane metalloprotease [Ruminococcus sp.]
MEYTETESRSEIAALSHEVYRLTKQLEEQEQRHLSEAMPDKYDPFDNPTDYKGFCGDYSKILPRITEVGYEIPLEPDFNERKNLKRSYRISGWMMILQLVLSSALGYGIIHLIHYVMALMNPGADHSAVVDYVRGSSILVSVNMMVYIICNVSIGALGMKWAGIKYTSLVRTKDFGIGTAFQYCMIGILLRTISLYVVLGTSDIFDKYGFDLIPDMSGIADTYLGKTVDIIYVVMIAPITEEFFFRGVLLRTLAKSNQRFAIFASALFFGLVHGNIQQFILATIIGVFLAHITIKHGSIIPSIIVHIFINTVSTIIGQIAVISSVALIICFLVLLAAALLGVIMLLVFLGGDKIPSTTPKQARRGLLVAVGSIPYTASVAIYVFYIVYKLVVNN